MYAIFDDPTPGQENVAGNCIWGPCSEPPWGDGYLRRDHWPPGLRDDLPDDWRPTPALDVLKAAKWEAVKVERDRHEQCDGFEHKGRIFDSDHDAIDRLLVAKDAVEDAAAAGTPFTLDWTLKDNSVWEGMTAADFAGLTISIAIAKNVVHQHARALREQIEAATTAEEIAAIPDW